MDYQVALEKSREASRKFMAVQTAYRAGKLSDTDFLSARAEYKVSESEFDAAYAKASR